MSTITSIGGGGTSGRLSSQTNGSIDGQTDSASLRRRGALRCVRQLSTSDVTTDAVNLKILQQTNPSRRDAITELEQLYDELSARLDDTDLLDRAERRDLPYSHQLYWTNDCNNNDIEDNKQQVLAVDDVDNAYDEVDGGDGIAKDSYKSLDKRRSMATRVALDALRDDSSGYGWSDRWDIRSRTPPTRRSAIPDIIGDDMAFRTYRRSMSQNNLCPASEPTAIRGYNSIQRINNNKNYLMSYLLTAGSSSEDSLYYDNNNNTADDYQIYTNDSDLKYLSQANVRVDDLSGRWLRKASQSGVLPPHPPFGIPNTIVAHSSPNDYIRAEPDLREARKVRYRYHSNVPHLIHDDMAYRSLRKDSKTTTADQSTAPTSPPPPPRRSLSSLVSVSRQHSLPNQSTPHKPSLSASLV